jgi:hypothetical protein
MLADIGHHERSFADPGVGPYRYARPQAGLFADGDVQASDTVLGAAVDDGNV